MRNAEGILKLEINMGDHQMARGFIFVIRSSFDILVSSFARSASSHAMIP
jgi:hypothetical protein